MSAHLLRSAACPIPRIDLRDASCS